MFVADETEYVRKPENVGEEQHQEDNQADEEDGSHSALPSRQLIDFAGNLADFLVRERGNAEIDLLGVDPERYQLLTHILALKEARDLLTIGRKVAALKNAFGSDKGGSSRRERHRRDQKQCNERVRQNTDANSKRTHQITL